MPRMLTPAELEIMNAFWELGEAPVRDVVAWLPGERAVTTVSTLVRILEQKGFVKSRKAGRQHVYRAAVAKDAYQRRSVKDLVHRVFGGDARAVVRSLVSAGDLTAEDVASLRRLLKEEER